MNVDSLLVYAPSWIGDAVMSLGAVRALKRQYAGAELTVLTRPWVRDLYAAVDAVDKTLDYDTRGEDRGVKGFLRATRRIREGRFDACVLLPNAFRAAAIVRAAGIGERWGYATESRKLLLTRAIPPAPRPFGRHQAYFYLDLVRALGVDASVPDLHLEPTSGMRDDARALLEEAGWSGRTIVGVHPGATNSRAKLWPAARYASVAGRLAASHGAQVAVLGGPTELPLAEAVRASLPGGDALMLAGKTNLGELIGVLSTFSVFLTNDSGPMHLAASLGVPTVAVFGPTDARENRPLQRPRAGRAGARRLQPLSLSGLSDRPPLHGASGRGTRRGGSESAPHEKRKP